MGTRTLGVHPSLSLERGSLMNFETYQWNIGGANNQLGTHLGSDIQHATLSKDQIQASGDVIFKKIVGNNGETPKKS